jgi:hypothetical protein
MRKRSEVKKDAPKPEIGDGKHETGFYCAECGLAHSQTSTGITCPNAHDAPSVTAKQAKQLRAKKVITATTELAGAIEQGQADDVKVEEEKARTANPLVWDSANRPKKVHFDPEYGGIIEKLVVAEPLKEYDTLEAALKLGDRRNDRAAVLKALDEAETYARRANKLWQGAILERKRWGRDNEVVLSGMRSVATRSLQHEKEQGLRNKAITDADVEARMAARFPDEWREQESKADRMKAMVDSMENLADMWVSRCRTLQAIYGKQR